MSDMVNAFWTVLNLKLSIMGVEYSLYDVFIAGIIFEIVGFAIGKIIFSFFERR